MYSYAVDAGPAPPLIRRLAARRFTGSQLVAIDAAAVAVVIVAVEFVMTRRTPRVPGAGWDTAFWAACLAAAAAALARRRAPGLALAVVVPIAVATLCLRAGEPAVFLVAMTLYSVVTAVSRPVAPAVTGLAAAVVLAAILVGGGLQVGRALAGERAQIARDLHDIVARAMSVIAVRSGVARMVIDSDPEQARDALAIIEITTRRALHEMRLLVGMLRGPGDRPAELSPVPGLAGLDRLLAGAAVAGVAAEVDAEGEVGPLPPAAGLSAYRIVQEALTNVVRHAGPTHARVRIGYRPAELSIEVTDDGPRGQAPRPIARAGGGHGLIGMRERAALFGGKLEAGPYAGGFRVRAGLPLEELSSAGFGDGA